MNANEVIKFSQFQKKQKKEKRKQTDDKVDAVIERGIYVICSLPLKDQTAVEAVFIKRIYLQYSDGSIPAGGA